MKATGVACAALVAVAVGLAFLGLPGAERAAADAGISGNGSRAGVPATDESGGGAHLVPLFPSAADAWREGFVRVINRSAVAGEVAIAAIDDAGRRAEQVTLAVGASEAVHFNSHDLEQGNPDKGLSGGAGTSGEGDWRLEFSSALDIEVLAYVRAADGFLTAMHDVVGRGPDGHRVAIFNPGRNRNQASLLRLINPGAEEAVVTITGIDDAGVASAGGGESDGAGAVTVTLPAGGAATVAAAALESAHERGDSAADAEGASPLTGALGAGTGKWQLRVTSEQPVVVMSLLMSPTGHLTNLSTAPYRSVAAGPVIRAVAENTEGGVPIGEPVTVDLGAAAVPTHRLEGADAEAFAVDAASGQLRTREGTDYNFEAKAAYALTVVVADGLGGVVGIPVTVEVTDEDEPPAKPGAPEVEGSSSRSVLVRWEEPANRGPAITDYDVDYRRPGAAEYTDAEHEGVGREIEITHLRQRADYEFRVRASNDEGTGEWSEPTVGRGRSGGGGTTPPPPASNAPPVFTSASSFAIPENTIRVATLTANDPDSADRIVGYVIAGGADGAAFEIVDDSVLAFVRGADYERPTDVDSADPPNDAGDNVYIVTVSVTGGTGGRARETEQTVTVTVLDTRLEAPSPPTVAALSSTRLRVAWTRPENSGPGITDYDVRYRAEGEDQFTDAGYDGRGFATTLTDLRPDTAYEAQVRAHNAEGPSRWSLSGRGTTSANQPPAFLEPTPRRSVREDAGPGEEFGAPVRANDSNGDPLSYRLGGLDAALFGIEADTGQLTTGMGVRYDHEARDSHELTVTADDRHGGRATVDVTITVTDVPEPPRAPLAPAVTASTRSSLDVVWTAPENAGRPVIDDYDVHWRVDGGGAFVHWDHAGAATSATIAGLDASTDHEVRVRATNDEGTGPWSPSVVGRTELNRAPTFAEGPSARRELRENAAAQTNVGARLRATDVDGGDLRYGLEGPDAGSFAIVETSGQLRTRTNVDYNHEERTDYEVTARATDDQGGSATIAVTVRVTDVGGEAPEAPSAPAVRQTTTPTTLEVTWQAPANAGPLIENYDVQYREREVGPFVRAAHDGTELSTTLTDLDPATEYEVQVRARNDEGTGAWSDPGAGTTLANREPTFDQAPATTRELAENTPADRDIGAPVGATDADGGTLTYGLGGPDAASFAFDADTGQLRTRANVTYDHEQQDSHDVTVTVADGQGGSASIDVTVAVTDLEEPPGTPPAPVVSATSSTSLTARWTAPENTGPEIQDYDYRHKVEGPSNWLGLATAADTETAIEGLAPETGYEVQVRANNDEGTSGWSASGRGTTDPNRKPAFRESRPTRQLAENTRSGVDIGDPVEATDPDDDALTYRIGGADGGKFIIDRSTGQLLTRAGASYDHEAAPTLDVTVTAEDEYGASVDVAVRVAVTDEPEPPAAPAAAQLFTRENMPHALYAEWSAPGNSGRPPISGYRLRYGVDGSGTFTTWPGVFTGISGWITGLMQDTRYEVQVQAINDEGDGGWSASGRGTTPPTRPTVSAVAFTSDPGSDGTYQFGDTVEVTLTFSEDVTVDESGGTPSVALVIGNRTRQAGYASSPEATKAVFRHTVAGSDEDRDGATVAANGLALNGGSIRKRGYAVDAILTHDAHAGPGHKVDGVLPALRGVEVHDDRMTLTFSETLDGASAPAAADFQVTVAGGARTVDSVAVRGETVELTLASAVSFGQTATVSYVPGTNPIRDAAGNGAVALTDLPVRNQTGGVCGRTPQIRDAITRTASRSDCGDVTFDDLVEITWLDVSRKSVSALKTGDFAGLVVLRGIDLDDNQLTALPAGVFGGLADIKQISLSNNDLSALPGDVFSSLTTLRVIRLDRNALTGLDAGIFARLRALEWLQLNRNQLSTLPAGIFSGLPALETLELQRNQLETVPEGVFSGLTALEELWLSDNRLATLPAGIFSALPALRQLYLRRNRFSELPPGIFSGLTAHPDELWLQGNPTDPLPVTVSLESSAAGQFRAVAQTGAPFGIVLPIRVDGGGIDGGIRTATIPQGDSASAPLDVSRAPGASAAVTVDLAGVPRRPATDRGYSLVASANLPLEVLAPVPQVRVHPQALTVREGGSNSYTVVLNSRPTETVTVTAIVSPSSEATASPTRLTFTSDDWHTPQAVTLTTTADADTEDGSATVLHVAAGGDYGSVSAPNVTVTVAEAVTDTGAAPVFDSPDAYSVTENETLAGTVSATDADDEDSVTGYAITGGADQDRFRVAGDGALRFVIVPDYERPADADRNNVYELGVTATSGAGGRERTATRTVAVTVGDEDEPPATPPAPRVDPDPNSRYSLDVRASRRQEVIAGPAIDDYDIQYRVQGEGDFRNWPVGGTLKAKITGLEWATLYEVQVRATNDEGTSDWSPSTVASTRNGAPRVDPGVAPESIRSAVGGAAEIVYADRVFLDPDGDDIEFTVSSANSAVAAVSVRLGVVTIVPGSAGTATVTITARDAYGAEATHAFDVTVSAPALGRPDVSIDGAVLEFEFTDSFAAGETRAYELRARHKSPRGPWAMGCHTVTESEAGSQAITLRTNLAGFFEPGTVYEADYGYRGETCDGPVEARSAAVDRTTDGVASFDIELIFSGSFTSGQEESIKAAARRWMEIVEGGLPNFDYTSNPVGCGFGLPRLARVVDDHVIYVTERYIDGSRNTLAQARHCRIRPVSYLPIVSIIEFDSADLPGLLGGLMEDVALHEMGHALGIDGPLWKDLGMLENPSLVLGVEIEPAPDTHFTGALAIAEFNSRGGLSYSGAKVPVENGAGQGGARDTHWRRSVLGTELMATGIYTLGANPLSSITIEALADLGYDVDKTQADTYWVSGAIGRDAPGDFLPLGCGVGESRGVIEAPVVIEMRIERELGRKGSE